MSDRIGAPMPRRRTRRGARVAPIDEAIDGRLTVTSIDAYRLFVVSRKLDDAISDEVKRRIPDTIRLSRLKKIRLSIRDKLANHRRGLAYS
jgi:hypothetical protein